MNIHVHRWTPAALTEIAITAGFTPYLDTAIPDARLVFRSDAL
jgi:hypothetical protein